MSNVQAYLAHARTDKKEAQSIAQSVAKKLESKELKLLTLIESLAEYINHNDDDQRALSIAYLANVLECLPLRFLTLQQRTLLTEFVLSRIQDDASSTGPCVRTLAALEARGTWTQETAVKIVVTLVTGPKPLRDIQLQSERFAIITLLDTCLAKYRPVINSHAAEAPEFVGAFIAYLDGEKDPRNLMLVFSILQVPATEWPLGDNAQELFDSVYNYFPITFKPPPNDPYGITAHDLKDRLRLCIASNSVFAPFAFPALLDKLDSTALNTKRDVLHALTTCVENYDATTVATHSVSLWEALKVEVNNAQETDLVDNSLLLIGLLARRTAHASQSSLTSYLKPILRECNAHFDDAPTKQSQLSGRILASLVRASNESADFVLTATLPVLLKLFDSAPSTIKQRGLVEVFNQILSATGNISGHDPDLDTASSKHVPPILTQHAPDIFMRLLRIIDTAPTTEVSLRTEALKALCALALIPTVLSRHDIDRLLDSLNETAQSKATSGHDSVVDCATTALLTLAHEYDPAIIDRVVPALYAQLPDSPTADDLSYQMPLELMARLSVEPQVAETIFQRVKNKLFAAQRQPAPVMYMRALLSAILYIFTTGAPRRENGVISPEYYWQFIKPFMDDHWTAMGSDRADNVSTDLLARICLTIISPQSSHVQNQIRGSLEEADAKHSLLDPTSQAMQSIIFSTYLYAAFQRDTLETRMIEQRLASLIALALSSDAGITTSYALRHITIIANKFLPTADVQTVLSRCGADSSALLGGDEAHSLAAVHVAFAVLKGLIPRSDMRAITNSYLAALSRLLSSETLGTDTARRFGTLLAPDMLLTKTNHCILNNLYRQRIYNQLLAILRSHLDDPKSGSQKTYIAALCSVLPLLPYSIISPSVESIATILLRALDINDSKLAGTSTGSLTVLESVLLFDSQMLSSHAGSLVSRLLATSTDTSNSSQCRLRALRCLKVLPTQFAREVNLPYRKSIITGLLPALDDRRREVRAEAVGCRMAWNDLDAEDDV